MLVAAFKIEVSRVFQFLSLFADRGPAYAGIEPDIKYVFFFDKALAAAVGALSAFRQKERSFFFKPDIGAGFPHLMNDLLKCFFAPVWLPAFFAVKYGNGDTPGPLS